jgi:N-methylhydantoinase A
MVPKVTSGLCAFGAAISDVKHSHVGTYIAKLSKIDMTRLNALLEDLEARGRRDLREEGFDTSNIRLHRTMEMRYADQIHECVVAVPMNGALTVEDLGVISNLFHSRHEEIYTYCERNNEPELVNVEVTAVGLTHAAAKATHQREVRPDTPAASVMRKAYFEEFGQYVETPVLDGRDIAVGVVIQGPAIIEEPTTTIVVFPQWSIELQPSSYYLMTRQRATQPQ